MNDQSVDEMTFEEAMRALEEVVGKLERGDVPLDDSIALSSQRRLGLATARPMGA